MFTSKIKRVLALALTVVLLVGVLPMTAMAASQDEAIKWCTEQKGKQIEYNDTNWMYQCFDFVGAYADAVFGYRSFGTGLWYAKNLKDYFPNGWTNIQGNDDVKPGDVFVFDGSKYNAYAGHTGVVKSVSGDEFTAIDQNYEYNQKVDEHTYSKSDIIAVLRPPVTGSSSSVSTSANIANGTYAIVAYNANFAIDINGGSKDDGGNVHIWQLDKNNINQQFFVERQSDGTYKITAAVSGKVLDVKDANKNDDANVQQWGYGGGDNQKWYIVDIGGGWYKFVAKHSGKCLNVSGNQYQNGINVQQYYDDGSNAVKFKLERIGVENGEYNIIANNGFALDIQDGSKINSGNLQIWGFDKNNVNQRFKIEWQSDGTYKITAMVSGKALDVKDANKNDCANVQQWDFGGGDNQKWNIVATDNGRYKFVAKHSGKCLNVSGSKYENGTNIQQYRDDNTDAVKFKLEPVADSNYKGDRLTRGQKLTAGQYLLSSNRQFKAIMQTDGNFVIYTYQWSAIFNTATDGKNGAFITLQGDGNFVLYSKDGAVLRYNYKSNNSNRRLPADVSTIDYVVMQDDGNLVGYTNGGKAIWESGTGGTKGTGTF
jgi:hypothetical protein